MISGALSLQRLLDPLRAGSAERLLFRVHLKRVAPVLVRAVGVLYIWAGVTLFVSDRGFIYVTAGLVWLGLGITLMAGALWGQPAALLHLPVAAITDTTLLTAGSASANWVPALSLPGGTFLASFAGGAAPPAWTIVAGYGVHLLLLAPSLGLDLARRLELRRRASVPPAEFDLYRSSPFRLLALDPTQATTRAILRRRDELRAVLSADLPPADHLPGFTPLPLWAGDEQLAAATVENAAADLQSPPERLRRELFWFHLEGECSRVLSALGSADLEAAAAVWDQRVGGLPETMTQAQALFNLAVARHLQTIEEERRQPFRKWKLDHLRGLWRQSLELWALAVTSDACWEFVRRRAESLADPRVNASFLNSLRQDLPIRLLTVNATLARKGAELRRRRYARLHLELIRSNLFSTDACRQAERIFFAGLIEEIQIALAPVAAPRPQPLKALDAKDLASRVRRAAKVARSFDGRRFLTRELSTMLRRTRRYLSDEVNLALKDFRRINRELWATQVGLVDRWNRVMTAHNQGLYSIAIEGEYGLYSSVGTTIELQRIHSAFQEAGRRLRKLDKPLAQVRDVARQSKTILRALLELQRGAGDGEVKRLREDLEFAGKAAEVATKETQMIRGHHHRNVSGMALNVGG